MNVLIPVFPKNNCKYRERNLEYVSSFYENVVIGECRGDVWIKGDAVRNGLMKSTHDSVLINDSDMVIPGLEIKEPLRVVKPNKLVYRLTESATDDFINGVIDREEIKNNSQLWEEPPMVQCLAGGSILINREVALNFPMDRRFYGWGKQDVAWGLLLKTFFEVEYLDFDMIHLWHPPQERRGRFLSSKENERLVSKYAKAYNNKNEMEKILEEIQNLP